MRLLQPFRLTTLIYSRAEIQSPIFANTGLVDSSLYSAYSTPTNTSFYHGNIQQFFPSNMVVYQNRRPEWSPDGLKAAFECTVAIGASVIRDICVAIADQTGKFQSASALGVSLLPNQAQSGPTWSPDGNWIAYYTVRNSVAGIWAKNRTTLQEVKVISTTELTQGSVPSGYKIFDTPPDWASDNHIYFSVDSNSGAGNAAVVGIYKISFANVMGANYAAYQQVTSAAGLGVFEITSGRHHQINVNKWGEVAFVAIAGGGGCTPPNCPLDTVFVYKLVNGIPTYNQVDNSAVYPVWSPTDHRLAYLYQGVGTSGINRLHVALDPFLEPYASHSASNILELRFSPQPLTSTASYYNSPSIDWRVLPFSREVPPEALDFHLHAAEFGLPPPFNSLPYDLNARGDQPADPLFVNTARPQYSQGYGPSTFSYLDYYYPGKQGTSSAALYYGTFQVHPGLDYGLGSTDNWTKRVVISLCDGVVIQGRGAANNGAPNGGSASPGRGVSVRCFMDSLNSGRADTDGDGLPNLSNIVIVYNHLLWNPADPQNLIQERGPYKIDCAYIVPNPGCTGINYELPRFRYPDPGIDVVHVNDIRVGDVVRVGTVLGQTGSKSSELDPDHLHLEIWLARGYIKPDWAGLSGPDNSININPYLMYTASAILDHALQNYFPKEIFLKDKPVLENFGIAIGELTYWSLGGVNFVAGLSSAFYTNLKNHPGSGVEWDNFMYRLVSFQPFTLSDLIGFLEDRYGQNPYIPIDCPIAIENVPTRNPQQMEIASCIMPDLQDHNY